MHRGRQVEAEDFSPKSGWRYGRRWAARVSEGRGRRPRPDMLGVPSTQGRVHLLTVSPGPAQGQARAVVTLAGKLQVAAARPQPKIQSNAKRVAPGEPSLSAP